MVLGPPGSGKGTQADLVAKKYGLVHFDTGKFLEALVHDPRRQHEKMIQKQRELFDSGKLMTPRWVLTMVRRQVKAIARAGWGVVFSGSPRTLYEAEGLLPVLEKLYGKRNIFVFSLQVPARVSIERNSHRVVCAVCGAPLLTKYYPSSHPRHCPVCAGPFRRRTLDNPEVIRVRLREYRERTQPIFTLTKKRGYLFTNVNGTLAPYKVFQRIGKVLDQHLATSSPRAAKKK
ncbi:hypothetical protein D6833_01670 [Candidatus Parcubacteria bacterium]|nr:MAG: hypothetical protein D6833_01670 [Candidatus Parcubacteria bacterium]